MVDICGNCRNTCDVIRFRARIFKLVRGAQKSIPPAYVALAGIFKQEMGARYQVGIELSYRPGGYICRLTVLIPYNRFLGSVKVYKFGLCRAVTTTLFLLAVPIGPIDCSKIPAQISRLSNQLRMEILGLR